MATFGTFSVDYKHPLAEFFWEASTDGGTTPEPASDVFPNITGINGSYIDVFDVPANLDGTLVRVTITEPLAGKSVISDWATLTLTGTGQPDVEYLHTFDLDLGTWTHTRASIATAPNADTGQIVEYASGEPAWYTDKGVQIEDAATNTLFPSNDFLDATWQPSDVDIAMHPTIPAPDGSMTAWHIKVSTPGSGLGQISDNTGGVGLTYSMWARSVGASGTAHILAGRNTASSPDLAGFRTLTPEWKRYTITGIDPWFVVVDFRDGNQGLPTLEEVLVWGGQVEATAFATSYVPTVGSGVTRVDSTVNAPVTSLSPLPVGGVADNFCGQFTFSLRNSIPELRTMGNTPYFFEMWGDSDNYAQLRINSDTDLRFFWRRGGLTTNRTLTVASSAAGMVYDVRFRQSTTQGVTLWINGDTITSSVTGTNTTPLSHVYLNNSNSGTRSGNTAFKFVRIRTAAISDAEIEAWPYVRTHTFPVDGLGQFSFSRTSPATAVSPDGVVYDVATGSPAYYKNRGLIIEDVRTNHIPNSSDTSTNWSPFQLATVTGHGVVGTRGVEMDKLVPNTSNNAHRTAASGWSVAATNSYAFTWVLKAAELEWVQFSFAVRFSGTSYQNVNIRTGELGLGLGGMDVTCDIDTNGFAHVTIVETATSAGGTPGAHISIMNGDLSGRWPSHVGDNVSGVYLDYHQAEDNTLFPTSYIPTAGGAVTRSTTPCITPFTDLGGLPPSIDNDYCVQLRWRLPVDGTDFPASGDQRIFDLASDDNTHSLNAYRQFDDRITIHYYNSIDGDTFIYHTDNRYTQPAAGEVWDLRLKKSSTEGLTAWLQGVRLNGSGATGSDPANPLTRVGIGRRASGASIWQVAHVEKFRVVTEALSDAEIEAWDNEWVWDFREGIGPWTHTRGSVATGLDHWGSPYTVTGDTPAFVDGGLQHEKDNTNYIDRQDLNTWDNTYAGTTFGHLAPDGSLTANQFSPDWNDSTTYAFLGTPGEAVEPSFWFKLVDRNNATLFTFANPQDGNNGRTNVDLNLLTEGEWVFLDRNHPAVEMFYDWQFGASGIINAEFRDWNVGTPDASTVQIWGIQVEPGEFSTSFIPTPFTRNRTRGWQFLDTLGYPVAGLSLTNDFCAMVEVELLADWETNAGDQGIFSFGVNNSGAEQLGVQHYPNGGGGEWRITYNFRTNGGANQGGPILTGAANDYPLRGERMIFKIRKSSTQGLAMWAIHRGVTFFAEDPGILQAHTTPVTLFNCGGRYNYSTSNQHNALATRRVKIAPHDMSNAEIESWS